MQPQLDNYTRIGGSRSQSMTPPLYTLDPCDSIFKSHKQQVYPANRSNYRHQPPTHSPPPLYNRPATISSLSFLPERRTSIHHNGISCTLLSQPPISHHSNLQPKGHLLRPHGVDYPDPQISRRHRYTK
ncbi:hypothetical protein BJX63DRAFT_366626 [Aspergillus granulosus]|uniref:Uncharacterized protein n=1 Tax=Aspergillus granulosus TaxID=176169 RepID=A0ABR4H1G9_9EURO